MTLTRSSIKVTTEQIVVREASMRPYVGFEHPLDIPEGWTFDIKRWGSPFDLKLPSLPRLSDPSIQGVSASSYFRSGVGAANLDDLYVSDFTEVLQDGEKHWYPFVSNGFYYRYNVDYFYYSDNSVVQYINTSDNRDGRNYIELSTTPDITTPILAATFKRDSLKENTYKTRINQRYRFTGIYSSGTQLETVSDLGTITWANVDTTKREFVVDSNTIDGTTRLWFNRDYSEQYGVIPTQYNDLAACEYLGLSTGSDYQVFYLENFPVLADSSFHLYVANSTTWEEWTRMDSWWDLITGSWSYPNTKRYFLDKDLGIVYFGSAAGSGVPTSGTHIVAAYTTVPRIEYEELNRDQSIVAIDADVNPVTQSTNQGFVCISHSDLEAATITLEINKQKILGTASPIEYGPITVGSDYGILKANVLSASSVPVSDVEVGFTISPVDLGYLDGDSASISVTDSSGDAYTTYQPPVSSDELGFYTTIVRNSTHASYPDDRELILSVSETGLTGKEDEIYLYQILKDDPIMGHEDLDALLLSMYQADTPSWVQDAADYAQWSQEMILEHDLEAWDGATVSEGDPINGRKVVVYQQYGMSTVNLLTDGDMETVPSTDPIVDGNFEATLTDVIVDGDMEAVGVAAWSEWDCTPTKDTTPPLQEGTQHLRLTADVGAGTCTVTQSVLTSGKSYRITGWARSDGTEAPKIWVGSGSLIWTGGTTGTWEQFNLTFLSGGTDVDLGFTCSGPGGSEYVEFDDIEVLEQNGSWLSSKKISRESSDIAGSTYCLRLHNTYATAYQNVLTIGKSYKVSGKARSSGTGNEYPLITHDGSTMWTGTISSSWQDISFTFIATATDFTLATFANAAGEYSEYDNITVIEQNGAWDTSTSTTIEKSTITPYEGSQCLKITAPIDITPPVQVEAHQLAVTTIGVKYRITGWARSDGTQAPLVTNDATTLWTGGTTGAWEQFDVTFTATATGIYLAFTSSIATGGTEYVEFDDVLLINYETTGPLLDSTAVNPVTGSLGAYVPVRPYLVEQIDDASDPYDGFWRVVVPAGSAPDCGVGSSYEIGGYWLVSSKLVTFQAHCWSPYYNQYIYSDSVIGRISLPEYMLGEYINTSDQKVPFGWKLVGDNDTVASGIDGATFITINPHSGPYNVIDLVGGTGETDEWASAPFRTLGFTFEITTP